MNHLSEIYDPFGEILVVEDNLSHLQLMSQILSDAGYRVRPANDGDLALQSILKKAPDLILLDMQMPGMNGIEVCRQLKADTTTQDIPVIFISSHADTDFKVNALKAGGIDYVTKPVDASEVLARIKTHLNLARLQQKLKAQSAKLADEIKGHQKAEQEKEIIQQQLFHARKMESIGKMAAGVAHEISNPISFISSNLETLGDYLNTIHGLVTDYRHLSETLTRLGEQLPNEIARQVQSLAEHETTIDIHYLMEDSTQILSDCRSGSDRIATILGDLKYFAQPGKEINRFVDINTCLKASLKVVQGELFEKAVVVTDFGDIPAVEGVPEKLNQAFMNIMLNAAQAIEEKGQIRIQTQKQGEQVHISISDTGCGIEKEDLSKIFDPFYTTRQIGSGTGLGMHVAYHVIKDHHGRIQVDSSVGQGTTFTITLPAVKFNP
ncbi:MAG: response regulator [Pseudomonadota bacterium]